MITHRRLQIFLHYGGDPDGFSRGATEAERLAMPEHETWAEIDSLLSSLVLLERGLVAPSYADEIVTLLKRLAADENVADEIRRIVREQASRAPL